MRKRLRDRVAALEKDWSPIIASATGGIFEVERRLKDLAHEDNRELRLRLFDIEKLLEATVDRLDELENPPKLRRLLRAPEEREE